MRIVVNDIAASCGGAMTILRDFYTAVCDTDKENEWIFLLNDRYFDETDNVKILTLPQVKKSKLKKLIFDFISGRHYIKKLKPDVVFSLQNIITFGLKAPQVVYIHQSIPFQSTKRFSFIKKQERKLAVIQYLIGGIIKLSAKKSDCIIVQTQWMKEAVCRICRQPETKVLVSLPKVMFTPSNSDHLRFDNTSFFYPTADAIYKNNDCIRTASTELDRKGIRHHITMTLPPETINSSITYTGRLPYDDVMKHYQRSTLVFPSYIETFGYPLAEARQMGTVVLASDTDFSREVLHGYENAYFFDPFQPEQLAELMEAVITGEIKRKSIFYITTDTENCWKTVIERIYKCKSMPQI